MKFTAKRLLAAGAVGLAAIVTPLSLTVAGIGAGPASIAGATTGTPANPDKIIFGQTSTPPQPPGAPAGVTPSYFEYVPGNGSTPTFQNVTGSGKCGTPTATVGPNGNGPILNMVGEVYPNNTYTPPPTTGTVGSSSLQVGVCDVPNAWTLDNSSSKGKAEALDFTAGDTKEIGANRLFTEANIPIQRKDSGTSVNNQSMTTTLLEFSSTTPTPANLVGEQTCTIHGGQGTLIYADTTVANASPAGACVNTPGGPGAPPATGFNMVEVQDGATSTSISVVGQQQPATFTLASEICGGQTISTPNGDPTSATLTLVPGTGCKTYTSFSTQTDGDGNAALNFAGFGGGAPVQFNVHVTWPVEPLCQPYVDTAAQPAPGGTGIDPAATLPVVCPVHKFSFNGTDYYDQAYCQQAQKQAPGVDPQLELCTVEKTYSNDVVTVDPNPPHAISIANRYMPDGITPATQITETWAGYVDWWVK